MKDDVVIRTKENGTLIEAKHRLRGVVHHLHHLVDGSGREVDTKSIKDLAEKLSMLAFRNQSVKEIANNVTSRKTEKQIGVPVGEGKSVDTQEIKDIAKEVSKAAFNTKSVTEGTTNANSEKTDKQTGVLFGNVNLIQICV